MTDRMFFHYLILLNLFFLPLAISKEYSPMLPGECRGCGGLHQAQVRVPPPHQRRLGVPVRGGQWGAAAGVGQENQVQIRFQNICICFVYMRIVTYYYYFHYYYVKIQFWKLGSLLILGSSSCNRIYWKWSIWSWTKTSTLLCPSDFLLSAMCSISRNDPK